MYILYEFFLLLFCLLYLPYFLLKRKARPDFKMRLGYIPGEITQRLHQKKYIWIHAVSVGEAMVAVRLSPQLKKTFALDCVLISTVTAAGNAVARSRVSGSDVVLYAPLDFGGIVKRVLKKIRPVLFVTVETELWPNLFTQLHRNAIPIAVINGRISRRSLRGYKLIAFFFKGILDKVDIFCMQTKKDAERIIAVGAQPKKVVVSGNIKFDEVPLEGSRLTAADVGYAPDDLIVIAGSTHHGEEEILISTYKKLIGEFPHLRLIVAPRHLERFAEIEKLLERSGLKTLRFSAALIRTAVADSAHKVMVVDTMGKLKELYSIATVVFIGGSLIKKGGHNIIEPAVFEKPILFGPFMHNFQDIADLFLEGQAALQVSPEGLTASVRLLLTDAGQRDRLGRNARAVVMGNRGATARTALLLKGDRE